MIPVRKKHHYVFVHYLALPKKKPVYKTAKANKTTKQKNNKSDPKVMSSINFQTTSLLIIVLKQRECGGCRRVFVSVHHLERHLHNRSRCRDRLCRICFKGFSSVDKLCTHVCTGKDGLFTCPQCKTQHLSAEFLLRHTCTTSKEDYSCIFCPREFKKDYVSQLLTKLYSSDMIYSKELDHSRVASRERDSNFPVPDMRQASPFIRKYNFFKANHLLIKYD